MTIRTQTTTFPPRTILDEDGAWSGVILSVPDFQTFLRLLANHADWETLPSYLQDAVDNMLADEAENELDDIMPLAEFLADA